MQLYNVNLRVIGEILDFSSIEHIFVHFHLNMFICTNNILWANGEILDFSSIEHVFVHLH